MRFSAKRNGGARAVSVGGVDNAVVRQGRGCRTAVAVTQRQPACANVTGHRTSIPFGHHAISKTLALADDIALSEPPDIRGPNGISVSQVYGVTEECIFDSAFTCESGIPFDVSSLASHRLPHPSLPALAGQRIRLWPNGMAVRFSIALGLTIMRSFVRVGVVERAETVTQQQPATANVTGHRTSIPFGHHAISKTFALADDIALSAPPDNCGPNGIPVSQVYGVTEERVSDNAFPCESGVPFGVSSLASQRLPQPSLPALASQRIRLRPNGMAVRGSLVLGLTIMRLFVRVGDCRMCRDRHPTTARNCKRHRSPHLHSVWQPRHIENVCPCR